MKIGKIKDGKGLYGPRYRITVDGKPTAFTVEKSVPAKYGHAQMWDVIEGDDPQWVLFDNASLHGCMVVFERLSTLGDIK